ncbi:cell envelope integrity protein TolA [Microvirga pudoricolor]|uniref:cell envelope integrity protein TolA n=1 Tax=Microvirga pudoricolor TaxID=2778729 RepID=UPI00195211C7|nr:cell envelope integrity protein TolA [Microvirga pudoricolor]MBM6596357.1 cell envelope integrity protein TolA [Microvirga pudoricolor]
MAWGLAGRGVLVLLACAGVAHAQDFLPFGDPDERQELLEPPMALPESRRGDIRYRADTARVSRIDTLGAVFQALQACWTLPDGQAGSGQEVTLRVSFRRDGSLFGEPQVTYNRADRAKDGRNDFVASARSALARCTPLPFSSGFGAANAGRPFNIRFIDPRPQ